MKLYVDIEKRLGDFKLKIKFETDKEVFSIIGASGSGKTMTLKCIAGIENPDKGTIRLGERILFDSATGINRPPQKRRIGYISQDYALFPNMTVTENIMCGAMDPDITANYIEKFFLKGKEHLYPAQLSGGEKQRVAIARMLSAKPELIMFDEPFNALDNYLKSNLEMEIHDAIESYNGQALFVSHDRDEVYRLTDQIAVMEKGHLIEVGPKVELFNNPQSLAAALLTGCKNISSVERKEDGTLWAKDWAMKLKIAEFDGEMPRYVGFRAHHFEVTKEMHEYNVVPCKIKRVVEDTFEILVKFESAEGYIMTYALPKEKWAQLKVQEGNIYLKMPENKIMIFER